MELRIVRGLQKASEEEEETFRCSVIACSFEVCAMQEHLVNKLNSAVQVGASSKGIKHCQSIDTDHWVNVEPCVVEVCLKFAFIRNALNYVKKRPT